MSRRLGVVWSRTLPLITVFVLPMLGHEASAGQTLAIGPSDVYSDVQVGAPSAYTYAGISMSGGSVTGQITAHDAGTVDVSGGNIRQVSLGDTSRMSMTGGNVSGSILADGNSTLDFLGGSVGGSGGISTAGHAVANVYADTNPDYMQASGSSEFNFFGARTWWFQSSGESRLRVVNGGITYLNLQDSAQALVSGSSGSQAYLSGNAGLTLDGSTYGNISVRDDATVTLKDGSKAYDLSVTGNGRATADGVNVESLTVEGEARVELKDSTVGNLYISGSSNAVALLGNSSVGELSVNGPGAYLTWDYGSAFSVRSVGGGVVNFSGGSAEIVEGTGGTLNWWGGTAENLAVTSGGVVNVYGTDLLLRDGHLSGRLQDGTSLNGVTIFEDGTGTLNLLDVTAVPEPPTLLPAAIAIAIGCAYAARWWHG